MNKYTRALSSVLVAGSMMLANCGVNVEQVAKKQEFTVTPSPLELHGNTVSYTAQAKLPTNMMKPGYVYDIILQYKPDNGEGIETGTVTFKGDDYKDSKAQPEVKSDFSFEYSDNLKSGELMFKGRATKESSGSSKESNGGNYSSFPNPVKGIITTSLLVQPTYIPNYLGHGYNTGEEYEPQHVDFFFLKNSSSLRYSEKRSEQGKKLDEYVAAKNPTRTITITGSHSPEGPTDINTKLANERPIAVEKHYMSLQDKYKYDKDHREEHFVTKPVIESWTAFKDALSASDKFTDAQKDEILSIVNGSGDFVSKELKLQSLSSYSKLVRYVYPPLRNAKTEILKIKQKKTEAEIAALGSKIASGQEDLKALSVEELRFAAHMTPDLNEKLAMYEAVLRQGDDAIAHNNIGAIYFAQAKKEADNTKVLALVEKAVPHFESSIKLKASAEAYANLAGAKLMMNDVAGAEEALEKASGSSNASVGASVNAVKGFIAIKKGEYDAAIQFLSSAGNDAGVLYNKALAYDLKASKEGKKEFDQAASTIKEAIEANSNNAAAHYLSAIIEARKGSGVDAVVAPLKEAIKLDKNYASIASQDLEFLAQRGEDAFKAATQN